MSLREELSILNVEIEQEDEERWIAEVTALPGVLAYGATELAARACAASLALRVIADLIEHGEPIPTGARSFFAPERANRLLRFPL